MRTGGASRGGGHKLGSGSGEAEPHAPENEKTKKNKPGLIAVWARDTLDLEIPKPQLQDLDKPWEKLTPLIPGNEFLTEMKTGAGADGDAGGAAADAAADTTTTLPSKTLLPPLHLRPPLTLATPLAPRLALTLTTTTTTTAPSSFPASASEEKGLHPTIYLANTPTPTTYYPNANTNAPTPTPYTHSPLTILLLDDYPLKARLQPYTRFCIPEYSRDVWVMWVLSGAEGDKGGTVLTGIKVVKVMVKAKVLVGGVSTPTLFQVPLWAWAWVPNLQQVQEREREEGRGIQATDGPTEIEIPTDENAVTEDVVANTSIHTSTDSIVPIAPTVPNSPAAAKKLKRKRTLKNTGSTADISASVSTFIPTSNTIPTSLVEGKGESVLPSNVNLGTDIDISLILQKTNSMIQIRVRRLILLQHWHGFFQARTSDADGPSFINQCPIPPGNIFHYAFDTAGQTGYYGYHSHLSTQYCDGLRGAFVIYEPHDPLRHLYDVDDDSTIITLADWYNDFAPDAENIEGPHKQITPQDWLDLCPEYNDLDPDQQ
ncbi:hypothetical protein D9758_016768 [Tetrapyrgos nigripes]|uniref:Plastocyanin-like domain-containing protein n=1 Tax=Tetrapyrgos nigripes TaxID=182062 RepID=A0A8H5CDV7_9AGAR|nr:hypothetical protein D9758_016768 [Tetrapyrgos nigripes]